MGNNGPMSQIPQCIRKIPHNAPYRIGTHSTPIYELVIQIVKKYFAIVLQIMIGVGCWFLLKLEFYSNENLFISNKMLISPA